MITVNVVEAKVKVYDHPDLTIFRVSVETQKTTWGEVFASPEALEAFIRGVKAGAAATGNFDVKVERTTE